MSYCKDIIALDSNGLSDPFIVWDLCPRHLFKDYPETRTSIKKKTLNPIYDEAFDWSAGLHLTCDSQALAGLYQVVCLLLQHCTSGVAQEGRGVHQVHFDGLQLCCEG